jgi:rhodanese-related sulfurtransferase
MEPVDIAQVSPAELAADTSGPHVLDVREPEEVAAGRIPGSANIPLSQLPARVGELDRGTPIVAVCRSGRRSQAAAEALAGAGFTVANLAGGMNRWTAEGRPTV